MTHDKDWMLKTESDMMWIGCFKFLSNQEESKQHIELKTTEFSQTSVVRAVLKCCLSWHLGNV